MTKLRVNEDLNVNYSPMEREVFRALYQANDPLTFEEIAQAIKYDGYNANITIGGAVRSLTRKARFNGEKFEVFRTKRAGPVPVRCSVRKRK